jgi:hypothetical protein
MLLFGKLFTYSFLFSLINNVQTAAIANKTPANVILIVSHCFKKCFSIYPNVCLDDHRD